MATPFISGGKIREAEIPEGLAARIGPSAPERGRLLTARALLPMPPEQLGLALGVLARDPNSEVARAAKDSLNDLPDNVVYGIVSNTSIPGPVLDVFAHEFREEAAVTQRLVANRSTLDETIRWMARHLKGAILEIITANQVRIQREPKIVEAMIANPAAPTPVLARLIETTMRLGVETSRIAGFKALADAFFAGLQEQLGGPAAEEFEEAEAEVPEPVAEAQPAAKDSELYDGADPLMKALLVEGGPSLEAVTQGAGIDDTELEELLTGAFSEMTDAVRTDKKPMWKLIEEMSLPQKVRLALMGDAGARKILVREKKKMVAMAVLNSPKITPKEIAAFALDRALDGEVIRTIARNREWTKQYNVMHSLTMNPKTPVRYSMNFIKNLRRKDLQGLAKAKDVPGHIARSAKQLIQKRDQR